MSSSSKRTQLMPEEIRFLRHAVGWTDDDLAPHLGVPADRLAAWQRGEGRMGPVADRLLRVVAGRELGIRVDDLTAVADEAAPLEAALRFEHDEWRIVSTADPAEVWARATPEARAVVLDAIAPERFVDKEREVAAAAVAVLRRAA